MSLHPNLNETATGAAFGDSEAIDIYLDTTDTALVVSSATGTFSTPVLVPANATPGTHHITAIDRKSGDAAQAAFTSATGQVLWSSALNGPFYSSPAFSGTSIYVASNAGGVYAVNTSGTKLWGVLTTVDFSYASPVVANGVVYIGSTTGTVYALNASTGATIWSNATAGEAIYSTAAVVDGIVYVGSYSGIVYALNASTGAQMWSYTTGSQIRGTPAVVNGVVYIASFDSYLYALVAHGANCARRNKQDWGDRAGPPKPPVIIIGWAEHTSQNWPERSRRT